MGIDCFLARSYNSRPNGMPFCPITDLSTMETKLENNQYSTIDDLMHDAQLSQSFSRIGLIGASVTDFDLICCSL